VFLLIAIYIQHEESMDSDMEKLVQALERARDSLMNELMTNKTLKDDRAAAIRARVEALKTEIGSLAADASIALAKIETS